MDHRWICVLAVAGMAVTLPAAVSAQTGPRASPGLQQPQLRDDEQILPSQIVQPPPAKPKKTAAKPKPAPAPASDNPDDNPVVVVKPVAARPSGPAANPPSDDNPAAVARPAAPPKPAEPARTVACSNGAFAKNSGHLRLAQAYGVHNVDFTQVAGDDGSTLMASVLFPNDPKKRLEVLWDDDNERAGTRMIVIDNQSTWTAQKGVHLGLPLAAMEKLNGKPFKLMGFDKGGMAVVTDWNGGALGLLTDGCRMTVEFKPDQKAPAPALEAAGADKEFASSDPAIRAAKPTVGEILVGY
jgi:hypothetical protein